MSSALPVCRSCKQGRLQSIIDFGRLPLANAFLDSNTLNRPEPTYPLELAFCQQCALVQILETVPAEMLFRNYLYCSSFSETMLRHAHKLANQLIASRRLNHNCLVIEAASNDGYLLRCYRDSGIRVLGIEPAVNIARIARERHAIPTRCEFFNEALGLQLRNAGDFADLFHAHNVLAHVADLNGFVAGIRHVLKNDGMAIIEVPYVRDLVDCVEFDTIYHEHLCYFSLTSLVHLFQRHNLIIHDVERLGIHGGSIRLHVVRAGGRSLPTVRVAQMLGEESAFGMDCMSYYEAFGKQVAMLKVALCESLAKLKGSGKRLVAYGASAKGSTLLNYFGIGKDTLDYVVDRSTIKQGHFTPGTRLPIYSPDKLLEEMPEYVLLLTWNFADEIFAQQAEYRRRGGAFILPIPEVRVA